MKPATITTNVGDILAGKYRVDRIIGLGYGRRVRGDAPRARAARGPQVHAAGDARVDGRRGRRFLREAKSAVKLRSEHVVSGDRCRRLDTGAPYISWIPRRYDFATVLQGACCRSRIRSTTSCRPRRRRRGARQQHRSSHLKPSNLPLDDNDGSALVKSSISGFEGARRIVDEDQRFMGSPTYMAPEQMASSKKVDTRADVWAFA